MNSKNFESRRTFLKSSTVFAAGTALAASLNLGLARTVHAEGDDVIKIALIGCGGRGLGAAEDNLAACERTKIVAVADAFENSAKEAAKRWNIDAGNTFWGLDAYKKAIAADVDMVILATPPGFRPLHYKTAIEAGKHVFMEKPCCVDAPGYLSLLETNKLADKKSLKVGVGLQRRHKKSYVSTIAEIHEGKYGDLVLLQAYWNGGPIWWRDPVGDMNEMQKQVRNWYHFCWLSGDNICEQHIHNLDVCNWAKNAHPIEANGMGGDQMRRAERAESQLFDHHFVEYTYPDGYRMYSQCRQVTGCFSLVSEFAFGNKGPERIELGRGAKDKVVTDSHGLEFKFGETQQEHYSLVNAIRRGLPYNEGGYGATSSMTAILGRMASYSGKVVTWDEAVQSGKAQAPGLENYTWDSAPPVLPGKDGVYASAQPGVSDPFE